MTDDDRAEFNRILTRLQKPHRLIGPEYYAPPRRRKLAGAAPSRSERADGVLRSGAEVVKGGVGAPVTLVVVVGFILSWIALGIIFRFDLPHPQFPVLLILVNLPQVPILVSLQVSANLAERKASDRAKQDHETLETLREGLEYLFRRSAPRDPSP